MMDEPKRTKTARMRPLEITGKLDATEMARKLLEQYAGPPPAIEVEYVFAEGLKYRGVLYRVEEQTDE